MNVLIVTYRFYFCFIKQNCDEGFYIYLHLHILISEQIKMDEKMKW